VLLTTMFWNERIEVQILRVIQVQLHVPSTKPVIWAYKPNTNHQGIALSYLLYTCVKRSALP